LNNSIRKGSGRRSGQRFDAQHGVVTEALLFLGELDPHAIGDALQDATHYEPTPVAQFEEMLDALPQPVNGFTFVDIGAGLGRVVLLASKRPFRQIIGVEVSPALCETARDNVVRWRRAHEDLACRDLRIVLADATSFRFPHGDLVVYLYNPFGEASIARFAERLTTVVRKKSFVLYHTPVHRRIFDEDKRFECIADLGFGVLYALPSIPRSFCA
jgi:SAM-dependent methyltransferase